MVFCQEIVGVTQDADRGIIASSILHLGWLKTHCLLLTVAYDPIVTLNFLRL